MRNSFYIRYGKRIFDIIATLTGLIILSPFLIIIALLIKFLDGGPVLYTQMRMGKNLKPFNLIKFRSMVINADKIGPMITAGGDPRMTKIGRFLRKTKLDELPQLFNVLAGDMSLVGPRPEVERYVMQFTEDYEEILKVRPGITDFAAIEFRDEEAVLSSYDVSGKEYISEVLPQKIKLYKKYLKEMSFFTDIKLIFKTLIKIVSS